MLNKAKKQKHVWTLEETTMIKDAVAAGFETGDLNWKLTPDQIKWKIKYMRSRGDVPPKES